MLGPPEHADSAVIPMRVVKWLGPRSTSPAREPPDYAIGVHWPTFPAPSQSPEHMSSSSILDISLVLLASAYCKRGRPGKHLQEDRHIVNLDSRPPSSQDQACRSLLSYTVSSGIVRSAQIHLCCHEVFWQGTSASLPRYLQVRHCVA